ncbi:hypothetical protein ACTXT7_006412 [Hymenolepis weldensis]
MTKKSLSQLPFFIISTEDDEIVCSDDSDSGDLQLQREGKRQEVSFHFQLWYQVKSEDPGDCEAALAKFRSISARQDVNIARLVPKRPISKETVSAHTAPTVDGQSVKPKSPLIQRITLKVGKEEEEEFEGISSEPSVSFKVALAIAMTVITPLLLLVLVIICFCWLDDIRI